MARRSAIDASPPIFRGIQQLDKDVFQKSIKVLAAKVPPAKAGVILNAEEMRGYVFQLSTNTSLSTSAEQNSGGPTQDQECYYFKRWRTSRNFEISR